MWTPGTRMNPGTLHPTTQSSTGRNTTASWCSHCMEAGMMCRDTTKRKLRKGHATYCGEITMVDTWLGFLLKSVENMGLMDNTAIIFTTDHGFYFGEHGGLFGKMSSDKSLDGRLRPYGEPGSTWARSPFSRRSSTSHFWSTRLGYLQGYTRPELRD